MAYTILISVVLASTLGSISKAVYCRNGKNSPFLFTAFGAFFSGLFFVVYNKFQFNIDKHTVIMAILFSVCYLVCDVTGLLAIKRGSISLTSMFSSFSLLLPTLFGIVYWKESANPMFWIGILLFCISIVLVNINPKEKSKTNFIWLIFVVFTFFSNGGCSILQTYHQKTGGADFKAEFMIIAMAFVFVSNAVISLFTLKKEVVTYSKRAAFWSLLYGVLNAGVNLGIMELSSGGIIKQSIFFPVISVGSLVLVMLTSVVLFKEELTKIQYAGVAVGIVSIVLLQIK